MTLIHINHIGLNAGVRIVDTGVSGGIAASVAGRVGELAAVTETIDFTSSPRVVVLSTSFVNTASLM